MSTVDRKQGAKPARKPPVTSEILDRQPPRNLDAEKAVLGSILLLPQVCDDVTLILRPEDFYDDANRKLFAHLAGDARSRQAHRHDAAGRAAALLRRLRNCRRRRLPGRDRPQRAHGRARLHYAEIVRDKAMLRALIDSSTEILRDAYDDASEPREQLNRAEQKIFAILDERHGSNVLVRRNSIPEALRAHRLARERRAQSCRRRHRLCRSRQVDRRLHDSELIIIAARPSMGKTAFALNIAEYVPASCTCRRCLSAWKCRPSNWPIACCAPHARVDAQRLRTGHTSMEDRQKIIESAACSPRRRCLSTIAPAARSPKSPPSARRLKRKHKLGLIVIDYLQLIEPDNPKDNRQEQVARIARRLKGMARELKVPVVCLAQFNRQAEQGATTCRG